MGTGILERFPGVPGLYSSGRGGSLVPGGTPVTGFVPLVLSGAVTRGRVPRLRPRTSHPSSNDLRVLRSSSDTGSPRHPRRPDAPLSFLHRTAVVRSWCRV